MELISHIKDTSKGRKTNTDDKYTDSPRVQTWVICNRDNIGYNTCLLCRIPVVLSTSVIIVLTSPCFLQKDFSSLMLGLSSPQYQ